MFLNCCYFFHLVYWDWRIAFDFFLGGLGVGAFLYAIVLMFHKDDDQLLSVKIGSVLGPVAMSIGLLFMLTELGQPLRIYKTFLRFNFTSPLAWGGLVQEGFIFFSAIFAFLVITDRFKSLRRHLAIFAGLFALFTACYHSFLISFVTARPLWNNGATNVISIFIAINTGVAAVVLLTVLTQKGREEIKELFSGCKVFLLISLFLQISTCVVWVLSLVTGKADAIHAYRILNQHFSFIFWFGAIIVGLLFPFLVLLLSARSKKDASLVSVALFSIPILLGGFIFRYVLLYAGQLS